MFSVDNNKLNQQRNSVSNTDFPYFFICSFTTAITDLLNDVAR